MQDHQFSRELEHLYGIIRQLRGPDGCPWDRKQTPESIRKYLIEETAELADAMTRDDGRHICEETGDLFFILLLIIRMYEEQDRFTLHDSLTGIAQKMIRRHPHVFAGQGTGTEAELKEQWESIKLQEKRNSPRRR